MDSLITHVLLLSVTTSLRAIFFFRIPWENEDIELNCSNHLSKLQHGELNLNLYYITAGRL